MAFIWTEKKIKYFKVASKYTGFHRELGEIIIPYLKKNQTLCDMGCGLGFLDFEIAPHVKEITAIDFSELALDDYKSRLAESGVENIIIKKMDLERLSDLSACSEASVRSSYTDTDNVNNNNHQIDDTKENDKDPDTGNPAADNRKADMDNCMTGSGNQKSDCNNYNSDSATLAGEKWDVILLSFYGRPGDELDRIFGMAKEKAILIAHEEPLSTKHGKLRYGEGRPTVADYEHFLIDREYNYKLIRQILDFGQPFRDYDEVKLYFETYSREDDPVKREKLIEENIRNIEDTDDSQFPYFLSNKKGLGIFIVNLP